MKRTISAAVALAAASTLALSGCATKKTDASGGGDQGSTDVTIMVGGMSKIIYLPAALTQQLGYFKQQGLNVNLVDTPAGVTAETALIANQAQGVVGFYDHTIDMQAKGKCLESVVQFANVPGEAEVVSKDAESSVTNPAGFKGKKLGVTSAGSSTDFLTQYLAGRAGVTTSQYTTVKAGADSTFIAALKTGGIDAGMTTDPTIAKITQGDMGKVMVDMRTEDGTKQALGGLYPASSLYVSCDYVANNKATVQKLANAFVKTLKFVDSHSAAEIAEKMPADYKGSDPDLYVKAIGDSIGMFNGNGVMNADGAKNVLTVLGSFSAAVKPKKDSIDVAKTYTTEFAEAAK